MGREIKRVSLGFDWPIGKVWYGYMISHCLEGQHGQTCDDCRAFAKAKKMEMTSHDCPEFDCFDPPEGVGWQMWETTSEGSPMSPVFKTPQELAMWLYDNNASSFGNQTSTYEEWLTMITTTGWAPSAVFDGSTIKSGVAAISETET
jgi:hypothetical protein